MKTSRERQTADGPSAGAAPAARDDELYTLANLLAHEIRNPLNALALNLNLLARETEKSKAQVILAAAQKEVRRLDGLVTAFLRFARPKKPQLRLTDASHVLAELHAFIFPEAAKRNVTLHVEAPPKLDLTTDADLLKQALLNVILNSFEAEAKNVWVTASANDDGVEITVRDDGPGFAEPHRALEPFYSTKVDGTGLGLTTARRIAQELGGELRLGAPPSGAEVIFNLPR